MRLVVDDTLLRRCGPKVWAAFWAHDGSAPSKTKIGYGNTWGVAAVLVDLPFAARPLALPVAGRLWRGAGYPSRAELAGDLVRRAHQALGGRQISGVADAAYHHRGVARLPRGVTFTTRLKATAVLTIPPPPRTGKRGRPRKKGDKLGTLTQIAARATWRSAVVAGYGRTCTVLTAAVACQWYGPWKDTPTLLVLVRHPRSSRYYDLALLTTDTAASAAPVVELYAARWPAETMLQHTRAVFGTGAPRSRTARAVARTVPFQLSVHTLTGCWYATRGTRHGAQRRGESTGDPTADTAAHRAASPGHTTKTEPSLADMAAALRRVILAARISPATPGQPTPDEIRAVLAAWAQAA